MICPYCGNYVSFTDEEMLLHDSHTCPECLQQIPTDDCLHARAIESRMALQKHLDEAGVAYEVEDESSGTIAVTHCDQDGAPALNYTYTFVGNGICQVLVDIGMNRHIDEEHIGPYLIEANTLNKDIVSGAFAIATREEGTTICAMFYMHMVTGNEGFLYKINKQYSEGVIDTAMKILDGAAFCEDDLRFSIESTNLIDILKRWGVQYSDVRIGESGLYSVLSIPFDTRGALADYITVQVLFFSDKAFPCCVRCNLFSVPEDEDAFINACCFANAASNKLDGTRFFIEDGYMVAQSTVPFVFGQSSRLLMDTIESFVDDVTNELPQMVDAILN